MAIKTRKVTGRFVNWEGVPAKVKIKFTPKNKEVVERVVNAHQFYVGLPIGEYDVDINDGDHRATIIIIEGENSDFPLFLGELLTIK